MSEIVRMHACDQAKLLGRNLRRLRKAQGLKLTELADKTGVARETIIRLEADPAKQHSSIGTMWTWLCLAEALGVGIEEFVRGERSGPSDYAAALELEGD